MELLLSLLSSPVGGAVVKPLMQFLVLCKVDENFWTAVTNAPCCVFFFFPP